MQHLRGVVLSHNPPLTMASYKEVLEEQEMHAYTPNPHPSCWD